MNVRERIEGGPGRRSMPLPVKPSYSLAELLPRRRDEAGYRVPGEMGRELAAAFERSFSLLTRAHGRLEVQAPSKMLTPRWHRVVHHLAKRGLARSLVLSLPFEKGVPLYYFDIGSPFLGHETDGGQPPASRYSRGFSDDYDHALAKVVGECLERSTLLYFRMADLVRGSARALRRTGARFVPPEQLSVFAPWQKERRHELRFDDDSVFRWVPCTSLLSSRSVLLPAQLIYWTYPTDFGDVPEPLLREENTNGAGAFHSVEGALLSGLLECVQRDGFFRHWLRGIAPPRIDVARALPERTARLVAQANEAGFETLFLDVTSELGLPTCLSVLVRRDGDLPHISMGASCRIDGATAVHDALLEAASIHHVIAQVPERLVLPEDYEPFVRPRFSTLDRLAYWANPEHAKHFDFFLSGEVESMGAFGRGHTLPSDARSGLRVAVDALRRHGIDAYFYEADHPILDELGCATVRVVIPGLLPMYCDNINAPLGLARAQGEAPSPRWPHPFP
jgi:ribosomal protein S12 methylthiotransferase accessory factor